MTSVVGSVASALLTCATAAAATAVGPFAYLTMVLIVQAASSAVIGLPSDHLVSGFSLNVQSLPSAEMRPGVRPVADEHELVRVVLRLPYCTSWG